MYPDGDKWKGRYHAIYFGKGRHACARTKPGCSWSTELAIVVSRRSRREISLQKAGDRLKERKRSKKKGRRELCAVNKSSTDDSNALEERTPEGSRVSFSASVGSSTTANTLLASPRMQVRGTYS